jgi:hypothetical protein
MPIARSTGLLDGESGRPGPCGDERASYSIKQAISVYEVV